MSRKPKTSAPEQLSEIERRRITKYLKQHHPNRSIAEARRMWIDCRDWHLANGVERANWEATFRMWIRKQDEFDERSRQGGRRPQIGSRELPQEVGERGGGMLPLFQVIQGNKNAD